MSVLLLKSILTTVVLLLAIIQAFSGLRTRGYFRRIPIAGRTLRLWHRVGGDLTLALTTLTGIMCIYYAGVALSPPRVLLHTALGILAGLAMILKVAMTRRFRRLLGHALKIGAVAGFSLLGTFVFSALWYFILVF